LQAAEIGAAVSSAADRGRLLVSPPIFRFGHMFHASFSGLAGVGNGGRDRYTLLKILSPYCKIFDKAFFWLDKYIVIEPCALKINNK